MMRHEKNRKASVGLVIGFHDGKKPHLFHGKVRGKVADRVRGENGFGWDKVFIQDGQTQTYAEMKPEIKNEISHRGVTLKKFKDFLKDNYNI